MFKHNGNPINLDRDLVIGEGDDAITLPVGSLQDADTRAQYGITEHPDAPRPDDRFHWVADNGDGSFTATPKDLAELRQIALAAIKAQRQAALDSFAKSAGISAAYDENIKAATAIKAGQGAVLFMRDGVLAGEHIDRMAAAMGVTAAQFADYVLAENSAAAALAAEIEIEYVRLAYAVIPASTFDQIQTVAEDYQGFCTARSGS